MTEHNNNNEDDEDVRPTKRSKVVEVVGTHGPAPKEFLDENKASMIFHIREFATLNTNQDEWIETEIVEVFGNPFRLLVYPRGHKSRRDAEYVSMQVEYLGENKESNPVFAKIHFSSKTTEVGEEITDFNTADHRLWGYRNFAKRSEFIEHELDEDGTLTIKVDITIGTEKKKVWYPQLPPSELFRTQLYDDEDCRDVTFIVGGGEASSEQYQQQRTFLGHTCIFKWRAHALYDLIMTEKERCDKNPVITLPDIDAMSFAALLRFVYMDMLPPFYSRRGAAAAATAATTTNTDDDFEKAKSILCVADRFGSSDLKAYTESILVDTYLAAPTVIGLLLLADAHSCALLKEACMNAYIVDSKTVTDANPDAWTQLTESTALLVELLSYATSGRTKYVPIQYAPKEGSNRGEAADDDTNGNDDHGSDNSTTDPTTMAISKQKLIPVNVDDIDVTSLRERLVLFDLDVDGSRAMLVQRWNDHIMSSLAD